MQQNPRGEYGQESELALIACKYIFLVFMFWGFGRVEWNIPASSIICMVIFAITMVSFTCVRIYYYAIKCNFNRDVFEHLYFGSDSKCPVNRVYLMCLTCDKPPAEEKPMVGVNVDDANVASKRKTIMA